MADEDRTASLMSPAKLAQMASKPKAPVSPAAWLDKMATEAGHQHITRLAELRADLQLQATKRDDSALAADIAALAQALPSLDFSLLQQKSGFLSRLSGKSKNAIAEFATQYDNIEEAIGQVTAQAKALQARQAEQASRNDLALVEFEVEYRALEKIIDQGARWLQDMRNQLKEREAQAADDAAKQQVREDAQRCELLVTRLKLLRALTTAAHECYERAQAIGGRRTALVQSLQGQVASRVKDWRARVAPLANAAREGEPPGLALEAPMDCHRELQLGVKQAGADCAQLQEHEKALAQCVEALGPHLQAAG